MAEKGNDLKFDDTVQCFFYSRKKMSHREWEQLSLSINEIINSLSQGYLWNRDEFLVSIPLKLDNYNNAYLTSITCFGDNIEDEWFIVYLILELTKLNDDLIVYIEDSDGCFLLIEAADFLPSWINPDNSENRVFIHQGNVHIIHPELVSLDNELEINNAVNIITENLEQTKASPEIQTAIRKRINGYPQKIQENLHKAVVSLPTNIATILKLKPSLISPLVNTYCNHDMFDAKFCRKVNYKDCIDVQITFTKYLYAMLLNSKTVGGLINVNTEKEKKKALGFKLTCGYEIIMNQSTKDIFASSEYKKFLNSLTKMGYFKDNIEGSKNYNQLLEKAKSHFVSMECPVNTHAYNEISSLLAEKSFENTKKFLLNNGNSELSEDSDDWLNISPDQLNNVLTSRFGSIHTTKDVPQNITSALTEFLQENSDFEGIERNVENLDDKEIDFCPEQFSNYVEKYLNFVTSEGNIQVSDESACTDFEDDISQEMDKELNFKLCSTLETDHRAVQGNLIQSMKEEGLSGPSSNVLKTIGINKTDLLDSDDDE